VQDLKRALAGSGDLVAALDGFEQR
jgi:hypothetical protein